MRILIANRGEIAGRIIRTAERLGHETVAAYADPDRDAPHVRRATTATRLGPADLHESYLSIEAVLAAAARTGSTAVHPGYGFLSERADAARAVEAAGLVWIGPHPGAVEQMGSKIAARALAERLGVPVIPGFADDQSTDALTRAAERIGLPVLVKASSGGGGKGIRIVTRMEDLPVALAEARAEAERSFGDASLIVERYVTRPRHVEVQVVGDRHGTVVALGTRECSVQRRYQKLLEEAPAPNVPAATEATIVDAACRLAEAIGYDSVGTVEYVLDDDTGQAYFLEMNTRLQVEHPVTELVTGLDLVELQLRAAAGERLALAPADVVVRGHAIEVRVNAEDPGDGYAPQAGVVEALHLPPDARWDGGIEAGTEVTPRYDSMLGKLVVHGADRETARRRLARSLDDLLVAGIRTNTALHRWTVEQPAFVEGRMTTRFLDDVPAVLADDDTVPLAALAWLVAVEQRGAGRTDAWRRIGPRRFTAAGPERTVGLGDVEVVVRGDRRRAEVLGRCFGEVAIEGGHLRWVDDAGAHRVPAFVSLDRRVVAVATSGSTDTYAVRHRSGRPEGARASTSGSADVRAPFPAVVTEVRVGPGDDVEAGDVVVVVEAMKMLHSLLAGAAGSVAEVLVAVGDQVTSGQTLVTFEEHDAR
jgi:acetyl/propionyl-CoA carboxylase alpha subunit